MSFEVFDLSVLLLLLAIWVLDMRSAYRQRPRPSQRQPLRRPASSLVTPVSAGAPDAAAVETARPLQRAAPAEAPQAVPEVAPLAPVIPVFQRIRRGLSRTRHAFADTLSGLLQGQKAIDDSLLEEIETLLLTADVGITATTEIIKNLTDQLARNQLRDADALKDALHQALNGILAPVTQPLLIEPAQKPFVILVVGVNGVGKTTTIGKLARRLQLEGKKVVLAAGDTFRAAAVEQLKVWGERNQVPVIAQHTGADSASVIFDAVQAAQARGFDVVIADTAGRLQNKDNLMAELSKVVRVIQKLDGQAPHEVMLVLDAGTGQNALNQAQVFQQAVGVTGITLTKLDGTAKGGIIFAIARQLGLPIRFIGVGEQAEDLRPFVAEEFVNALFADGAAFADEAANG